MHAKFQVVAFQKKSFLSGKRMYANPLLLWVQIFDATGCFVKALPIGQNIGVDKLYTKKLGQISILEHCKR